MLDAEALDATIPQHFTTIFCDNCQLRFQPTCLLVEICLQFLLSISISTFVYKDKASDEAMDSSAALRANMFIRLEKLAVNSTLFFILNSTVISSPTILVSVPEELVRN